MIPPEEPSRKRTYRAEKKTVSLCFDLNFKNKYSSIANISALLKSNLSGSPLSIPGISAFASIEEVPQSFLPENTPSPDNCPWRRIGIPFVLQIVRLKTRMLQTAWNILVWY